MNTTYSRTLKSAADDITYLKQQGVSDRVITWRCSCSAGHAAAVGVSGPAGRDVVIYDAAAAAGFVDWVRYRYGTIPADGDWWMLRTDCFVNDHRFAPFLLLLSRASWNLVG